ncbi:neocarzinostatin apoprotein domain-containing protein [Actinocorallia longicatena]|uniref:Neocarzinostatin apoprotein domain-containing protein n=1 Tax=Actinocorallia longicatena TaxID=111803 RepID=A0ABP6Q4K7_9ACTN
MKALKTTAAIALAGALAFSSAAHAAPKLSLSKTTGLKVGDVISVTSLTGLAPNLLSVAVGQCKPKVTGTSDCNISGSLLGTGDASGKWKPGAKGTKITLVKEIGGTDCTAKAGACVIGVTSLTDPSNVLTMVPLTFSSSSGTTPTTSSSASPGTSPSSTSSLPNTGSPDGVPTFALAASALVLTGLGVLFLLPRRRTR